MFTLPNFELGSTLNERQTLALQYDILIPTSFNEQSYLRQGQEHQEVQTLTQ